MSEIFDNQLHSVFVSPQYCKELLDLGCTNNTIHQWKIRNKVTTLFTAAFDIDDYYVAGVHFMDKTNPPDYILPAYTIKDCEKALPDYLLTGDSLGYEIAFDTMFKMTAVQSSRLPDVFACALIKGIREGKFKLEKINEQIMSAKV